MDANKEKLQLAFNYNSNKLPQSRTKTNWEPENYCGFLLGILEFGDLLHKNKVIEVIEANGTVEELKALALDYYNYYVATFYRYNDLKSCITSKNSSRKSFNEDVAYSPTLVHNDLIRNVSKRDGVCLCCWDGEARKLNAAHIVAQKTKLFDFQKDKLLERAELVDFHQVQNGLLLCQGCHILFDTLVLYFEVIESKYVVKILNYSKDKSGEKHEEWKKQMKHLKICRIGYEDDWALLDRRKAFAENGEMELYFLDNEIANLPSQKALEFHRCASKIWRLAGGADITEEFCEDENEDVNPMTTDEKVKAIQKWASYATLNNDIVD